MVQGFDLAAKVRPTDRVGVELDKGGPVVVCIVWVNVTTVHFQTIQSSLSRSGIAVDSQSLTRCAAR